MARKTIFKVLSVLGVVAVFMLGIWLGRLYSAAGGPGAVTLQQFRSNVVLQVQQLWRPSTPTPPGVPDSVPDVPRVRLEQLKEKLDAGADIVIVDVRSKEEFAESHIPGAVSIPWEEIEARYPELPRDKEIITYCARC
ncbi:MAG: rhodanese-like domain-containing protein [Anaerolineales bacterium]|nr:rhodanese-like domain-containing protein [Anaerolineales bacterium]